MKNTNKKALKAMLILAMLVTLCMSLAACAQTTETGTTDPIVLELVNVGLDILASSILRRPAAAHTPRCLLTSSSSRIRNPPQKAPTRAWWSM